MAGIFHPSRGGVRGGQDQFSWDDVKTDKDRENYLGHSVMAPVGKWQEGKDLVWYTKDKQTKAEAEEKRRKELDSVKSMEARAMAAALGHKSFSSGTTSLTAKELQDVLARGQTEHGSADAIKGMGYKKNLNDKQKKYGTEFVGGSEDREGEQECYVERGESKEKSSKKKKKEKKKKKKKQKKKRHASEEDSSEEEYERTKKSHTSKQQTLSSRDGRVRYKDDEKYSGKKRKSDVVNDSWSSKKSESSADERSMKAKRNKTVETYSDKKRKYRNSENDSLDTQGISHYKNRKSNDSKYEKEYVRNKKSYSEDESEVDSDTKHRSPPQSKASSNKKSPSYFQPDDSRIKFVSKSKRKRLDSSSGDSE